MSSEERAKTEILHSEIITALQWHLKNELKKTDAVSFAGGRNMIDLKENYLKNFSGFGAHAIAKYLRSSDAKATR